MRRLEIVVCRTKPETAVQSRLPAVQATPLRAKRLWAQPNHREALQGGYKSQPGLPSSHKYFTHTLAMQIKTKVYIVSLCALAIITVMAGYGIYRMFG